MKSLNKYCDLHIHGLPGHKMLLQSFQRSSLWSDKLSQSLYPLIKGILGASPGMLCRHRISILSAAWRDSPADGLLGVLMYLINQKSERDKPGL